MSLLHTLWAANSINDILKTFFIENFESQNVQMLLRPDITHKLNFNQWVLITKNDDFFQESVVYLTGVIISCYFNFKTIYPWDPILLKKYFREEIWLYGHDYQVKESKYKKKFSTKKTNQINEFIDKCINIQYKYNELIVFSHESNDPLFKNMIQNLNNFVKAFHDNYWRKTIYVVAPTTKRNLAKFHEVLTICSQLKEQEGELVNSERIRLFQIMEEYETKITEKGKKKIANETEEIQNFLQIVVLNNANPFIQFMAENNKFDVNSFDIKKFSSCNSECIEHISHILK
jgi:hypothetical protein